MKTKTQSECNSPPKTKRVILKKKVEKLTDWLLDNEFETDEWKEKLSELENTEKQLEEKRGICTIISIAMKKIKPTEGCYFKHENLIYFAKAVGIDDNCTGCAFKHERDCSRIDCDGLIFEDVTDTIEVDLVDEQAGGFAPFISIVGVFVMIISYMIYCFKN